MPKPRNWQSRRLPRGPKCTLVRNLRPGGVRHASACRITQPFPLGYLPGQYKDAFISPDGRWIAFTAEYVYGPEDLLVISNE